MRVTGGRVAFCFYAIIMQSPDGASSGFCRLRLDARAYRDRLCALVCVVWCVVTHVISAEGSSNKPAEVSRMRTCFLVCARKSAPTGRAARRCAAPRCVRPSRPSWFRGMRCAVSRPSAHSLQDQRHQCNVSLVPQGWEMLGNPYTSQFDKENLNPSKGENGIVRDNGKKDECACVCGNAADGQWYTVA